MLQAEKKTFLKNKTKNVYHANKSVQSLIKSNLRHSLQREKG